ncbi:MAG: STAS/SEC14 domain-containing protein [Desulfobacterales bacterium]
MDNQPSKTALRGLRDDVVVVRFFGRMLDHETRRLSRMLQQQIQVMGHIRLLLTIESIRPSGGSESLLEGLHFVRLHSENIDRVAVIGAKTHEKTVLGLFSLFSGVEIDYFSRAEAAHAIRWLNSP